MNSRRTGADGERELARVLREALGIEVSRNLQQTRDGGHDMEVCGFGVEVKRAAKVTEAKVAAWWQQATRQATRAGLTPALAYRQDRQPWSVRVPLSSLRPDLQTRMDAWTTAGVLREREYATAKRPPSTISGPDCRIAC